MAARTGPDKEKTIAYRLGRPYIDRLEAAAESHGLSRGQYARLVLAMHFEETATHRVAEELEKLRMEVMGLRIERLHPEPRATTKAV